MKNESFERAKILKEEIEKCNSLLESILKSSRECCVYRDAVKTSGDIAVITLPKYCTQYIINASLIVNRNVMIIIAFLMLGKTSKMYTLKK